MCLGGGNKKDRIKQTDKTIYINTMRGIKCTNQYKDSNIKKPTLKIR